MDEIWKREDIDSPCIKVCVMHEEAGICIGCKRTRYEIARWSGLTDSERAGIVSALPERAGLLRNKRRGGRKARLGDCESKR